jgi:hypothetical protein
MDNIMLLYGRCCSLINFLLSGQSSAVLLNFVAHYSTVCSAGFFYVFSHWSIFCDVWDGLCSLVVVLLPSNVPAQFSAAHK